MQELHVRLSGHVSGARLRRVLDALQSEGLVVLSKEASGGRPREVVRLVTPPIHGTDGDGDLGF